MDWSARRQKLTRGLNRERRRVCLDDTHPDLPSHPISRLDCAGPSWEHLHSFCRFCWPSCLRKCLPSCRRGCEQPMFISFGTKWLLHKSVTKMLHHGLPSRASRNRHHRSSLILQPCDGGGEILASTLTSYNPATSILSASTTSATNSARGTVYHSWTLPMQASFSSASCSKQAMPLPTRRSLGS